MLFDISLAERGYANPGGSHGDDALIQTGKSGGGKSTLRDLRPHQWGGSFQGTDRPCAPCHVDKKDWEYQESIHLKLPLPVRRLPAYMLPEVLFPAGLILP